MEFMKGVSLKEVLDAFYIVENVLFNMMEESERGSIEGLVYNTTLAVLYRIDHEIKVTGGE